jgi:uncharacterized protein YbjT (DUF2867 family)
MTETLRPQVAIAGASGFIGRALIDALADQADVIALARRQMRGLPEHATFRQCNLYRPADARAGLKGAQTAFYLVHSMMPAARLVQAKFSDLDAICADNFARAAKDNGVKRIIYLGGLMPSTKESSEHLKSREEVREVLASYGASVLTLRAGLVVGRGGSSFNMLKRMVERLPVMLLPKWGATQTQPIALDDVLALLKYALAHPEYDGSAYDIGSTSRLSYAEMLDTTAKLMNTPRRFIRFPFHAVGPSLLWVSTVSGAPRDLVDPLVASLQHEMLATEGLEFQRAAGVAGVTFEAAVTEALNPATANTAPPPSTGALSARGGPMSAGSSAPPASIAAGALPEENLALSLQRFPLASRMSASDAALEYFRWLPDALKPWLRVHVTAEHVCTFHIIGIRAPLLSLTYDASESSVDRAVYRISGGLLHRSGSQAQGILEFRTVLGGQDLMTLVDQFSPSLPWFIYRHSQAVVHALVMASFGRHLKRGKLTEATTA